MADTPSPCCLKIAQLVYDVVVVAGWILHLRQKVHILPRVFALFIYRMQFPTHIFVCHNLA